MSSRFLLLTLIFTALFAIATTAETGDICQTDDQCPALHSCTDSVCIHKTLFPLSAREIIGTALILFMSSLLTAGGVGGGAAYVPYIMLLFEVDLQKAITYAYACAFGGGLGNISNTIFLKNPKTKRFMINYDVNLIILPALMSGVLLGSVLQRIFPPLVVNILLLLVLAYSMYKNALKIKTLLKKEKHERKAIEMSKFTISSTQPQPQPVFTTEAPLQIEEKEEIEFFPAMVEYDAEREQIETAEAHELNDKELTKPAVKSKESVDFPEAKTSDNSPAVQNISDEDLLQQKRHQIEQQMLKYPFHKLALLSINVVIIIGIGVIRGTSKFDPVVGVDWSCGWDFLWFGIMIGIFGIASAVNIYLVNKWQKEKILVGYEFLHEEPLLNTRRIISIMTASFIGGCLGSVVALGGGMVISPTLLDMGMPPAFSAAATGLLLVFSMFNTIFQQVMNKKVTGLEIAWFVPLAILCSYASSKIVNFYVRKTGRQSIILILLLLITFAGFGCIVYNLISGMVENPSQQTTFTSVC